MRWVTWLLRLIAAPATAHLTPNSDVQIDFGQREALMDVIIPLGEYGYATGKSIDRSAVSLAQAKSFLTGHVRITTPQGQPWRLTVESVEFAQIAGPPDLHAISRLKPPRGANGRQMQIAWNAVIAPVPRHSVLLIAR